MPELIGPTFSYRQDAAVRAFDDSRALFVFDGQCVLCSTGARWLMRVDERDLLRFAASADDLGAALYRHYRVDPDESYLLITDGRAFTASRGYLELCNLLGGAWRLAGLSKMLPEGLRDSIYAMVARNRYRWFGKLDHCALLTPQQRARLL